MVIHNKAFLDGQVSYLWNEVDDLAKQKEVLVAQYRLEDFDLLDFGMITDDFWILKKKLEDFLFVYFVIKGTLKLDGDALELLSMVFRMVYLLSVVARLTQLDEIGKMLQYEITVPVVDDDAQLVISDVLLDIPNSKENILVFW